MEEDLKPALEVLRKGGLILYPTDTIWGIGCDPTRTDSVERIYRLKKRTEKKSLLILADSEERIFPYVQTVPDIALDLIRVTDKPLSIIYQDARNLAPNLIGDDGSIGIRLCRDPFCRELIRRFRKPLVSTSANLHGYPSPANFREITDEIKQGVDYIVSWRQEENTRSTPSSIIWLGNNGEVKIIRE